MIPPDQTDGKAVMFAEWEDRLAVFDTLILCRFYRDLYQWDKLSTIIRSTTGLELDVEQMQKIVSSVIEIPVKQFFVKLLRPIQVLRMQLNMHERVCRGFPLSYNILGGADLLSSGARMVQNQCCDRRMNAPSLSPEHKELVSLRLQNRIGKNGVLRVISQQTRSNRLRRQVRSVTQGCLDKAHGRLDV